MNEKTQANRIPRLLNEMKITFETHVHTHLQNILLHQLIFKSFFSFQLQVCD